MGFLVLIATTSAAAQVDWVLRATTGPTPRTGHAMAYDSGRDVTVLFGGQNASGLNGETWEWNGNSGTWTQRTPIGASPSPRSVHAMAYDSARGVTVLYGANSAPGGLETWEWNGSTGDWTLRATTGPGFLGRPEMAYDSARGVTLLFGGLSGTTVFDDTWEWDSGSGVWSLRTTTGPGPHWGHAMVYDSARGVTVLFGGVLSNPGPQTDETWEWNGNSGTWSLQNLTGPSARFSHAMAYDSARAATVLFGGSAASSGFSSETWELLPPGACCNTASGTCTLKTASTCTAPDESFLGAGTTCTPNPCPQPGACCNTATGTCTLKTASTCTAPGESFLGAGTTCTPNPCPQPGACCNTTTGTCMLKTASTCTAPDESFLGAGTTCSPNPCPQPGACCDAATGTCTFTTSSACALIGGSFLGIGTTCTPNPCPPPPPPINDKCCAAISITVSPPLPSSEFGDTTFATLDPTATPCGPAATAPGVWYSVIGTGSTLTATTCSPLTGYDTQISVYCGGCPGLTCVGTNNDDPDPMCPAPFQSTVSWCSVPGVEYLILVHGFAGAVGPFELGITDDGILCSPLSWSGVAVPPPPGAPTPREGHAMAYDSARGVTVLFGGFDGVAELGDTWEWDGSTWSLVSMAGFGPGARSNAAMAFDMASGVTVLFGGFDGVGPLGDTWTWDGIIWTPMAPPTSPLARSMHAMAYQGDVLAGTTVLFGGSDGLAPLDDTWIWDGADWAMALPPTIPGARNSHAMAYDSTLGVTVLFGGFDGLAPLGDTWTWDGVDWAMMLPPTSPAPRSEHAMVYDSALGVTVLFGGSDFPALFGDTWTWDGFDWAMVSTPGPSARSLSAMAYDIALGETVLFGGATGLGVNGETWVLTAAACAPPLCAVPGDIDGSGIVDGLDIPGFIRCLLGVSLPIDDCTCADANGDGVVDLGDLPLFVTTITTGVPCP